MNDTYLRLGRAIAGRCPPGFESAQLAAEISDGRIGLHISCLPGAGPAVDIDPTDAAGEIIECLRLVRDEMAADGSAPWRSCKVTLRKGGHFSIDVSEGPLQQPPAEGGFKIQLG